MRRMTPDDGGSVVIITALSLLVLLGMAALVVDVGALLHERRLLQNGADAGALAVAAECGAGDCGDSFVTAAEYADANADDGDSSVEAMCGSAATGLAACADPPALPAGAEYVRVTTRTSTAGGSDEVSFTFARVFGLDGATVRARSTAAWGGPASLVSALPVTISQCEFNAYTRDGTSLAGPPPYDVSGYPSPEAVIYFHDTTGASACEAGPSGADLPGGFGWLETATGCDATSDIANWFDDKTGRPPPTSCTWQLMEELVGTVVRLPIFNETNDLTGTNGKYHMASYASFYLTGYSIAGQYKVASLVSRTMPCSGQASCISGFFVRDPTPLEGTIGGPSTGATVVALVG